MNNFSEKANFIWAVADLLRGPYRPNQYKDVMLPMTVLRRLDCVLEPTKEAVLAKKKKLEEGKIKNLEPILNKVAGHSFHNTSRFTFEKLKGDPNNIAANLTQYIKSFSTRAREIIEHFGFEEHIAKLDKADRLYLLVSKFCEIDIILNERFGTDFKPGDQLFFDSIREDAVADSGLRQAAMANTMENFGYVFMKALEGLFIDRMEQNEDITSKYLNEKEFQEVVGQKLLKQVYDQIRNESQLQPDNPPT